MEVMEIYNVILVLAESQDDDKDGGGTFTQKKLTITENLAEEVSQIDLKNTFSIKQTNGVYVNQAAGKKQADANWAERVEASERQSALESELYWKIHKSNKRKGRESPTQPTKVAKAEAIAARPITTTECCFIELSPDFHPVQYMEVLEQMLGKSSIYQLIKMFCILLKAFPEKIIIGNLPIAVKNDDIIVALRPYCKVASMAYKLVTCEGYSWTTGSREAFIFMNEVLKIHQLPVKVAPTAAPICFWSTLEPKQLFAANRSIIHTYGERSLELDLGLGRLFRRPFIIADVGVSIIGADFLRHYGLTVDLRNHLLNDPVSSLHSIGQVSPSPAASIHLTITNSPYSRILRQFPELTSQNLVKSPPRHSVTHHIVTKRLLITAKPRRLPKDKLATAKKEFAFMMEKGICRPSKSPWSSPLHLVPKNDGSLRRPCGDYMKQNAATVPDRYPVPKIMDFASHLYGKKIFSTINLVRAYHHVPVESRDIPKTAVTTRFGLFEFPRMFFGLCNAAQTFQRLINKVLQGLDFAYAYIDDVLIASDSENQHTKCTFGQTSVKFLGFIITNAGISPDPQRVQAIKDIPIPDTVGKLQRFLGSTKIGEADDSNEELTANVKGKSLQIMKAQTFTMELTPSQISRLIFRAPPFLPNDIPLWLSQLEAAFIFANISSDYNFKYTATIVNLDLICVYDIVENPPVSGKYATFKEWLLQQFGWSRQVRTAQVSETKPIADQRL
ncbi:hypothetical protein LAZ67_1001758 [Cordylochernes scorpioides]|uniref:Reverse transcriptase domain-containing protein n=1 Tax=Cordylochernes scorpioides TaxID=51811 RepID=A0ABY6JVZ5_9ARAC|nr:hypothetical protein LAZ67_1001758 [Cordylochernes scorpioides]